MRGCVLRIAGAGIVDVFLYVYFYISDTHRCFADNVLHITYVEYSHVTHLNESCHTYE